MILSSINHGFIRELWAILTLYLSTFLTGKQTLNMELMK